jgi:hypothetical protein
VASSFPRRARLAAGVAASLLLAGAAMAAPDEAPLDVKRDAASQALAAVRRGDFRVARMVYRYEEEHIHFGEGTPGLACDAVLTDAAARDLPWDEGAEQRFAAAYNRTLTNHPLYPDGDICVATGADAPGAAWPDFDRRSRSPAAPELSVNRAARASRPDLVESLIASGRASDGVDRWNRRPLHWAARRGDLASLEALLRAGARLDDHREPASALLLAADAGRAAAVERLLRAGADVMACGHIDARDSWGNTLSGSNLKCPIGQAVEHGGPETVRVLARHVLQHGTAYGRERLLEGLREAVRGGQGEVVDAFLDSAGRERNFFFRPAILRDAAYRLDRAMMRRLIEAGGAAAARTPAEARLWVAADRLKDPRPLALLVWFGGSLNYLGTAERARLESTLPGLTPRTLRPWLDRARQQRDRARKAALSGDVATLDSMAAAGVDLDEHHRDTLLSRAATADLGIVRWLLAHGARDDSVAWEHVDDACSGIIDRLEDRKRSSGAQRAAFLSLCRDQPDDPGAMTEWPYQDSALQIAVATGKMDRAEALLPVAGPAAALGAIRAVGDGKEGLLAPGQVALLPRLAALAAKADRDELADVLARPPS